VRGESMTSDDISVFAAVVAGLCAKHKEKHPVVSDTPLVFPSGSVTFAVRLAEARSTRGGFTRALFTSGLLATR
jgi:hypothetical protein